MKTSSSRHIFFIMADDDTDDHFFVKQACSKSDFNYEILSVYNGVQLMDLLIKEIKNNTRQSPDFILLDLNMPLLDGQGVLARLKNNRDLNDIPVYILTTSHSEDEMRKTRNLGAKGFYTKPVRLEDLQKIIDGICELTLAEKFHRVRV